MVRERDGAVDAVELATQIGLHVTTVRFPLDALCDEGVIVRTRVKLAGAGRPRTGYLAVEERLDYRILAEVLAVELGQTVETRARRAQRAGQKWAARITASKDAGADPAGAPTDGADDPLDRAALRATDVFTRMGFAAELATAGEPATPSAARGGARRPRGNGSFDSTPARCGSWPDRIPKWDVGYIWGCCRACSPSQPGRRAIEGSRTRRCRRTSNHSSSPSSCVARLVAG